MDAIKERLAAVNRWVDAHAPTRISKRAVLGFLEHEALQYAGSMAYFAVLSLFQLLVLAIVVGSFIIGEGEARAFVLEQVQAGSPIDAETAAAVIDATIESRGGMTLISFAFLLWAALGIFSALSTGISRAFENAPKRGFIQDKLVGLLLMGLTGILAIGSLVIGIVTGVLQRTAEDLLADLPLGGTVVWLIGLLAPLLLIFLAFWLIYKVVPNRPVGWMEVLPGAIVASLLWTVLRFGFTWYATSVANYESAFGPISTAITLLVFLYFASLIVLLGAEFARASTVDDEQQAAEAEQQASAERDIAAAREGGMPAPAAAPSGLAVPVRARPWNPRTWALMAGAAVAGVLLGRRSKGPPGG